MRPMDDIDRALFNAVFDQGLSEDTIDGVVRHLADTYGVDRLNAAQNQDGSGLLQRATSLNEDTPLNASRVGILLDAGLDPNLRDGRGDLPLTTAAGSDRDLEALLRHGANPNGTDEYDGRTALHHAVYNGNFKNVEALLRSGADPNAKNGRTYGETPLFGAQEPDIIGLMLDYGADPTMATSLFAQTPLHRYAQEGEDRAIQCLAERGADIHAVDSHGYTPLHIAVMNHKPEAVNALLAGGADPNMQSASGDVPLHKAARQPDDHGSLQALLTAGANPNRQNAAGQTPLHMTAGGILSQDDTRALLDAGADPNVQDVKGQTPLHCAAWSRFGGAAEALLNAGANPNHRDREGNSPLHGAQEYAVRHLLDHGANINARNNDGETPLEIAVRTGQIDTTRSLLERGADARGTMNSRAWKWAETFGMSDFSACMELVRVAVVEQEKQTLRQVADEQSSSVEEPTEAPAPRRRMRL